MHPFVDINVTRYAQFLGGIHEITYVIQLCLKVGLMIPFWVSVQSPDHEHHTIMSTIVKKCLNYISAFGIKYLQFVTGKPSSQVSYITILGNQ